MIDNFEEIFEVYERFHGTSLRQKSKSALRRMETVKNVFQVH